MAEGIQSPCNQPGGRVAREDDPPRLDFFPLPFAAAFFARSAAAVLSFAIVSSEILVERRRRDGSGERGGSLQRKGEEKQGRTVEKIWIITLYKATPEWLISGPVPPSQIPQQAHARYVAKKVAQRSRRPCLIQPIRAIFSVRCASQFSNPARSAIDRTVCQTKRSVSLSLPRDSSRKHTRR